MSGPTGWRKIGCPSRACAGFDNPDVFPDPGQCAALSEWESPGHHPNWFCTGCAKQAGLPEPEMSDRDKLFLACRRAPGDDLVRLAYADFLDEFGAGDRDAATAEFIRVSCDHRSGGRKVMPKAAFAWLEDNWHRLVPALVKLGDDLIVAVAPHRPLIGRAVRATWHRSGRSIWVRQPWRVWLVRGGQWFLECSIVLDFHRGFLDRLHCTYPAACGVIRPHLLADWPDVDVVDWR